MGDDAGAVEQIAFLTRAEPRVEILTHLLDSGPTTQREFRDHVDASRSTVTRALSALDEHDWIRRDGESWRLTPQGRIVADGLGDLVDTIRATEEISTFLEWFPYAEFDLDLAHIRGAEILSHTPGDPYLPARRQTELLHEVGEFRGLLPSLDIEGTRVVHERIQSGEFEAEIVVPAGLEPTLTTGEYATLFREQIRTGRLTVRVHDGDLPFYLGLGDDGTVQVGVEDDDGFPRALLATDSDDVRAWAESVYRDFRDRARVKPVEEF